MSSTPNGTTNACGSSQNAQGEYNKPLHVGALFVIMAVSTFAAIFPLIASRVKRLHVPQKALFVVKHFGTGVLMCVLHFPFFSRGHDLTSCAEGLHSATFCQRHSAPY
jgi:hypothetical protein